MGMETMDLRRPLWRSGVGALLALAALLPAAAQEPRVVTMIVPYPAGGIGDILPRAMADVLGQQTGRSFVVDNKPGATQTIGARLAAGAKPDGATIFFGSVTSLAINPSVKKDLPYDAIKDFEPIALTFVAPQYLLARRDLPANSVRELIELARRMPGKLNYASIGPASSVHLAAELLKTMAGVDITHVPYTGSAPAVRDTIAGHVDFTLTAGGMSYATQAKVLGVTSATRTSAAPDAPAIAETLPGYEATVWFGFLAPAGTPKEIIGKLNAAALQGARSPEFGKRMKDLGYNLIPGSAEEMAAMLKAELARWAPIVKSTGAKID